MAHTPPPLFNCKAALYATLVVSLSVCMSVNTYPPKSRVFFCCTMSMKWFDAVLVRTTFQFCIQPHFSTVPNHVSVLYQTTLWYYSKLHFGTVSNCISVLNQTTSWYFIQPCLGTVLRHNVDWYCT